MQKPRPLFMAASRATCPVCGETVYSRSGIHPQCAQHQNDLARTALIKKKNASAKRTATAPASSPLTLKAWHKRCPKCRGEVHIRQRACTCGYQFPEGRPAPAR